MRTRLLAAMLVAIVLAISAGCGSDDVPTAGGGGGTAVEVLEGDPLASPDPRPEPTGEASEIGPDGGTVRTGDAELSLTAGTVPEGATFSVPEVATIPPQPGEVFGQPVGLEHEAPLGRPATVRWTLPELTDVQQASIVLAKWDPETAAWVARPDVPFTVEDGTLTAELTEFSFWNWIANAGQRIGEAVGARKAAPSCQGQLPSWVRGVVDPDEDTSAAAIRVCFEPDRDEIVTTRVVNNRPFTQRLDMVEGHQQWAWAWPGQDNYDVSSNVLSAARTVFDSPTTFLLPALSETAVGIGRPAAPGQVHIAARASTDLITVLVDVVLFGFEQVNVGGFENPLLNALAQAMYTCGGKQLLGRAEMSDPEAVTRLVVDVVGGCAQEIRRGDSEFGTLFEDLSRKALERSGVRGDDIVIKANRLSHQAASAFRVLTAGKIAFYVSDQFQNALVGPLTLGIRGDGRPQELGAWAASCADVSADSDRIYRNLALRDEFRDTSREFWQFPQWAGSAVRAVVPLERCDRGYRDRLAEMLPGDWGDPRAAEVVADAIRALGSSSGQVRFDGIGDLDLSLTADDLLASGFVDQGNLYEGPEAACVSYTRPEGGVAASVESATGRVLALRNASGDELRTELGDIGVGSELWEVQEAFAQYEVETFFQSDFGQGMNGLVVHGPGGDISFGFEDAPVGEYVEGTVEVNWVAGVGLPGHAPTAMETGC